MLTDDEIKQRLRVLLSDASSEQESKEVAAGLAAHALIIFGRIATALEELIRSVDRK